MQKALYNALVNKHEGIRVRYHRAHDGTAGLKKVLSWAYLLWLNFAYYVLCFRFLARTPAAEYYEEKRLPVNDSESELYLRGEPSLAVDAFLEKLEEYDVISFDVFDTLIFRSVSVPTDVFYFIGERMGILDFRNIRMWAEGDARVKCREKSGHTEIGLADIWKNLAEDVGCDPELGMRIEQETELALCYANPFMLDVWRKLRKMGKRIVIISDMYLPRACIARILENAGFTDAEKIYISCEYKKNKASGKLFKLVKRELGRASVIHVGDNPHSDGVMARKNGFAICPYPNINRNMLLYRPYDMSFMIGSAYRALVSAHLYCGAASYSMEYEYGYLYGGLFVLGYCGFIHEYAQRCGIDRLLFLSRDGDILKKAYDLLYPGEDTAYAYWSRKAATKLMANEDRHDYFRRFIYHKINQDYSLWDILHAMELDFLADELDEWKDIWLERTRRQEAESKALALRQLQEDDREKIDKKKLRAQIEEDFSEEHLNKLREKHFVDLKPGDELTAKNGYLLRRFIEAKWDAVMERYQVQQTAAERYYRGVLQGCGKAAAVDIGWAGSGALALSYLVEKVWRIPCEVTGIIAGTNTIHNAEPDASEPFLQSGRLTAYLYSQSHNRDLIKKHDPNKDYNVFWELLLSSPQRQFSGFDLDEAGEVRLKFGKQDENPEGIEEIQRGILDFVTEYRERFREFDYMFRISGRDAYAPMLAAAGHKEKYLKAIEKRFKLEINVN